MSNPHFSSDSYFKFLNEHKIMGSRCLKDGALYLPPRALCPEDFSSQMEWFEFSGRGKLAAYSVIHIAPSMMIEAGYDREHPYCAGIVEMEEGVKISAQIFDVDVDHPETIEIGIPLEALFVARGEGEQRQNFLAFRPITAG